MSGEIYHEKYRDFINPDDEGLDKKIDECLNLVNIFKENNINYSIVGNMSLVLLSKSYYRVPSNIDILIDKSNAGKTIELLEEHSYSLFSDNLEKESFLDYCKNKLRKYAAVNTENCSTTEEDADLYYIDNGKFLLHKSHNKKTNVETSVNSFMPLWISHDPDGYIKTLDKITNAELKNVKKQIEIIENKFIVNFSTSYNVNRDAYGYNFYLSFYDKNNNLISSNICSNWGNSLMPDKTRFSNIMSPIFKIDEHNETYYRIFSERPYHGIKFIHKEKPTLISIYCNDFQKKYTIETNIKNQYVYVSHPSITMKHKMCGLLEKDFKDYEFFYKFLSNYFNDRIR